MSDTSRPGLVDHLPRFGSEAFDCPLCGAYAHQHWGQIWAQQPKQSGAAQVDEREWIFSFCARCGEPSLWMKQQLFYPRDRVGPAPHGDMPEDVQSLYEEAREVSSTSRRSAAALLRLALQVLVDQLQPGPGDINKKIGQLVRAGLDPQVQQAMDVLRVVGNNAVHPGQIDLDSDGELVPALFGLLNVIVEQVVARPRQLADLYGALPAGAQAAIARRDSTTP